MKRRDFLGAAAAATVVLPGQLGAGLASQAPAGRPAAQEASLGGVRLTTIRDQFKRDLAEYADFFIRHGIDFDRGGFMCSLDHDGTQVDTNKFHWFQGRGIWSFSHLYLHFEKNPRYLEAARKTCDFMLRYFPQDKDKMRWATIVAKDGAVVKDYETDPFGCYFGIEGLFELAAAAGDEKLFSEALDLYLRHYRFVRDPKTIFMNHAPGTRGFNMEMADLEIATQVLRRRDIPEVRRIADECVAVIMDRFYDPEYKVFNELLDGSLNRIPSERTMVNPGHGIEVMWIVMDEADRRRDAALFDRAKARALDLLELGWDHVYGGVVTGINIGQGCFEWPALKPAGMTVEFHERGEYNYVKSHWSVSEVLIATLMAFERSGDEWAARYFSQAKDVIDRKLSLRSHGYPLHLLFTDRVFTFQPHTMRKDDYHYMRAVMHCLAILDRMIGKGR
jgi:mannose/cellobiose epimerase-like protein (N-acyl-D-glucosamine 2-epimerase family)